MAPTPKAAHTTQRDAARRRYHGALRYHREFRPNRLETGHGRADQQYSQVWSKAGEYGAKPEKVANLILVLKDADDLVKGCPANLQETFPSTISWDEEAFKAKCFKATTASEYYIQTFCIFRD